jgi:hypothetical protein
VRKRLRKKIRKRRPLPIADRLQSNDPKVRTKAQADFARLVEGITTIKILVPKELDHDAVS